MNRSRCGRLLALAASVALGAAALAFPSTSTAAPAHPAAAASAAAKKKQPNYAKAFLKEPGGKGTCDPQAAGACEVPFPNNWFARVDKTSKTGVSLDFTHKTLPTTVTGKQITPAALNRNDGFSPGSILTTLAPNVDLTKSGLAPITDIGSSLDPDAPAVIVDMATGAVRPYWAELDTRTTDPSQQALLIHPASNLQPGHTYAVGLRNLVDGNGTALQPSSAFVKLRGKALPKKNPLHNRQAQLTPVFRTLAHAGIQKSSLYQAWGFTVASNANLVSDVVTMRNQSFAKLGAKGSPAVTVTSVTDNTADQDAQIARVVKGTVRVPNYLSSKDAAPGGHLVRGKNDLPKKPAANHYTDADFECTIPWAAFDTPGSPSLYGHGLLGSPKEIMNGSDVKAMADEHDFVFCATSWIGIASGDSSYDATALSNPKLFPNVIDRMKQALLNAMFVGRALGSPKGMAKLPAFQDADGQPLVDTSQRLVYDGNSQGGIMGGALVAVSPDIHYGVLGVPGMNYSVLLDRSADFGIFGGILQASYANRLDQQLTLSLIQILWDRAEMDGYASYLKAQHQKRVLMHVAYGDHQVATITAETEARTIGARISPNPVVPGRSPDVVPYWGIKTIPSYPYEGSAIVIWDSGSPTPPLTNNPPTTGHDPHEDPRNSPAARTQKAEFLRHGDVIDVCDGGPCMEDPS